MLKIDKHIEIVSSTRPVLSSMSSDSREGARRTLARKYRSVGIRIINNRSDLDDLVADSPDLVFLGMKFLPLDPAKGWRDSKKIWISRYLDKADILYTGSSGYSHELEVNKPVAKQAVLDAGLKTAPYYVVKQGRTLSHLTPRLKYPLFVKPTNRGAGVGIDQQSVVSNLEQLRAKAAMITVKWQSDSLVESYLPGREFSVAVMAQEGHENYSAMPIELVAKPDEYGRRILGQAAKAADTEQVLPVTDHILKHKLCRLALSAFSALGARDYGRIDIRLDVAGTPHFLEANLLPSLLEGYGNFPKACKINMNLDYEDMLLRIVELAFARQAYAERTPLAALPLSPAATI
jgi:D-alanine-D-alanine ligase